MAKKSDERRGALRSKLIDLAEAKIAAGGLTSVRARDLAQEAGCALGAIYNVFDDLTALYLAVNMRTFRALGQRVAASQEGLDPNDPCARLIKMGHAYLGFAKDNTRLWRALFGLKMSADQDIPDWYMQEMARLFGFIHAPLRDMYPDRSDDEIELMTRGLFSAVHGIVLLGLEKRISGVPHDQIARMITIILTEIKP